MNNLKKATITTLEIAMKRVYVVENEKRNVKIGVSQNVESRIETLSSQGGFEVKNLFFTELCSNAYEIENRVHNFLSGKRIGGEWFAVEFNTAKDIVSLVFNEISIKTPRVQKVITLEEIESKFLKKYVEFDPNYQCNNENQTANGLALFLREMVKVMEGQGSEPWKICEAFKMVSEQFGIVLPADFVKIPNYHQMNLLDEYNQA